MYSRILLLLTFLVATLTGTAQTTAYLGYCEGKIATTTSGHITGINGNEAWIDLAIRLPKSMLASYEGCSITGVHFGLPAASAYPDFATAWVRTAKDGANLVEGTNTGLAEGWNVVPTTKAYTITGREDELWVGVQFRQSLKLSILSFAGTDSPDGAWAAKNGNWTDYSSKHWGSLALEAIVEGQVPTRNLTLVHAEPVQSLVEAGTPIVVRGTIKNNAPTTAVQPVIRYDVNDGRLVGSYTVPATLAYREAVDFTLSIPTTDLDAETTANVALTLCWPDGADDDGPDDNTAQLSVEIVPELFYRNMVVEEATGAWCGWCVYGIVGLREMRQKYGDRFIGIAIHNGDQYVVGAYDSWIGSHISGYPSCLVNRKKGEETPMAANLDLLYQHMDPIADARIDLTARCIDGQLVCEAATRFFANHTNSDYRIVFVVTEDQLPILQKNYYAGNARGPMGGFENMEGDVQINVDDVARGVYPSATGKQGSIPADVEKGSIYGYRITTAMPKYRSKEQVAVVALLVDGKTGEVVQGAKTHDIYGFNADEPLSVQTVVTSAEPSPRVYDLYGRLLPSSGEGASSRWITVRQGRKQIAR